MAKEAGKCNLPIGPDVIDEHFAKYLYIGGFIPGLCDFCVKCLCDCVWVCKSLCKKTTTSSARVKILSTILSKSTLYRHYLEIQLAKFVSAGPWVNFHVMRPAQTDGRRARGSVASRWWAALCNLLAEAFPGIPAPQGFLKPALPSDFPQSFWKFSECLISCSTLFLLEIFKALTYISTQWLSLYMTHCLSTNV